MLSSKISILTQKIYHIDTIFFVIIKVNKKILKIALMYVFNVYILLNTFYYFKLNL